MENNAWSWEQKTLIDELIEGMEVAKLLRVQLNSRDNITTSEVLVQKILSSYEKALLILNRRNGASASAATSGVAVAVAESPVSINESPRSEDNNQEPHQDNSKKRKTMPRWTEKVKVSYETGFEGPHEDGYSWRKYGQKDILGAKYPRSYYRCTFRSTQNCWATKQVQRSDEDVTIFEVTYRGTHNCSHGNQSVPPPASPEKQEQKLNINHNGNNNHHQPQENQLQKGLSINNDGEMAPVFSFPSTSFASMKSNNDHCFSPTMLDESNFLGGFSSSFISPAAATESNHFLLSQYHQMNSFGNVHNMHHSESDVPEMLSSNNSAANSPILNLDFSAEIDPDFPFDNHGFSF